MIFYDKNIYKTKSYHSTMHLENRSMKSRLISLQSLISLIGIFFGCHSLFAQVSTEVL